MFPEMHKQQISLICQSPGKPCSREMLSEKSTSRIANDERYGINISGLLNCVVAHITPRNPWIVNYHYQHLWLAAQSRWIDLTAGRAHIVPRPRHTAWHFHFWSCALKHLVPLQNPLWVAMKLKCVCVCGVTRAWAVSWAGISCWRSLWIDMDQLNALYSMPAFGLAFGFIWCWVTETLL